MVLVVIAKVETGQKRQQIGKVVAPRPVTVGKWHIVDPMGPVSAEIKELN